MNPATTLAVSALRAADRLSPDVAGRLALPLFRVVKPVLPVRPGDRAVHDEAQRGAITTGTTNTSSRSTSTSATPSRSGRRPARRPMWRWS